jgi:predicted glycosyltransferase
LPNVFIPREIVDGPQLVYWSDLVAGAGGTMNREATVLGTPVYSQFQLIFRPSRCVRSSSQMPNPGNRA